MDPAKIAWIIREKEKKELTTSTIAERMGVSTIWVKKLWRRYRMDGIIPVLRRPGRRRIEASDVEKGVIIDAYKKYGAGACVLEGVIDVNYGTHIPHNRIHKVMKEMGIARDEPRRRVRKKWIRYERKYSNSLWHTDWTLIQRMGWLIAYLDDASRLIVGYGLFQEATSEHSVEVLRASIEKYGSPASILTDRGIQFYAVEATERARGSTVFERFLVENEIRHIIGRVSHPQTNGKVERFFKTVKDKLPWCDNDLDRLITWYNTTRPHMSLNLDEIETPSQAYLRKMPDKETMTTDEEEGSGEIHHAKKEE